jgi:hypothetical protein
MRGLLPLLLLLGVVTTAVAWPGDVGDAYDLARTRCRQQEALRFPHRPQPQPQHSNASQPRLVCYYTPLLL